MADFKSKFDRYFQAAGKTFSLPIRTFKKNTCIKIGELKVKGTNMRNRKKQDRAPGGPDEPKSKSAAKEPAAATSNSDQSTDSTSVWWTVWMVVYCIAGLAVAVTMGVYYAKFVSQLHENQMYFSRIEVGNVWNLGLKTEHESLNSQI